MSPILYILCYGSLIAAYGVFAFFGKVPVEGFIQVLTAALGALGAAHIASAPTRPAAPAAAPEAPAAPKDTP